MGTDHAFIYFPPEDRSCIHVSHEWFIQFMQPKTLLQMGKSICSYIFMYGLLLLCYCLLLVFCPYYLVEVLGKRENWLLLLINVSIFMLCYFDVGWGCGMLIWSAGLKWINTYRLFKIHCVIGESILLQIRGESVHLPIAICMRTSRHFYHMKKFSDRRFLFITVNNVNDEPIFGLRNGIQSTWVCLYKHPVREGVDRTSLFKVYLFSRSFLFSVSSKPSSWSQFNC